MMIFSGRACKEKEEAEQLSLEKSKAMELKIIKYDAALEDLAGS